jgi:rhodanese-related sulfurtransferase
MAKKKLKKKVLRTKRKKAAEPAPAPVAVKESPKKSGSNLVRTVVIAVVILAAAIAFGMVLSRMRASQLAQQAAMPTPIPTIVVTSNPQTLVIKDKNSNRTETINVKPASASTTNLTPAQAATAAAVASQGAKVSAPQAQTPPVAVPTSTNIPRRCRAYRKPVDSKANIYRIDIEDAKYLYEHGALFADARGPNEYAEAHIKGAINVPVNSTPADIAKLKDKLAGKLIVTYCHGIGCHLSDKAAYLLYDAGYRKLVIFFGGWPKWNEHKYPIETKNANGSYTESGSLDQ